MLIEPLCEGLCPAMTAKITQTIDYLEQFRLLRIIVSEICSKSPRSSLKHIA
jgi:hypothetical protein